MTTPKDLIGHIPGGKVLDVATGRGSFIGFLIEGLKDYTEIIGIDTNERGAAAFAEAFKDRPNVRFEKMDAGQMTYPDASFDTVCIANSLHHMADLGTALAEAKRVLRPDGTFIILEMYRDADRQTETQLTHVYIHHWYAAIDQATGSFHKETYTRQEILEICAGLALQEVVIHDLSDTSDDPKDPALIKDFENTINSVIQRAEGQPDLQQRGEELRQRIQEIGFHSAASLLAIGKKQVPLAKSLKGGNPRRGKP